MSADDLTPGQVAGLLEVAPSSLRRWARMFKAHLSPQATGKRRRYSNADLSTLARARDLLRAGKSPAEVGELLGTVATEALTAPAVAAVSLPAMAADLQAAQEALRAALGQLGEIKAAQSVQGARLAALESQLAAWQALPWWRRLFGGPPAASPPPPASPPKSG